jgi:hypothetical protein
LEYNSNDNLDKFWQVKLNSSELKKEKKKRRKEEKTFINTCKDYEQYKSNKQRIGT